MTKSNDQQPEWLTSAEAKDMLKLLTSNLQYFMATPQPPPQLPLATFVNSFTLGEQYSIGHSFALVTIHYITVAKAMVIT